VSPIERAARALCELDGFDPDKLVRPSGFQSSVPSKPGRPLWEQYSERVRAVLKAIREIDLATRNSFEIDMLVNGAAVLPEHDEALQEDALACWQAMIDAALQEG
jgi:hypothetical protein